MSQPFFVHSLSRAERKAIRKIRKRPPNVDVYRRTQAVYFLSKRLKVQQITEIVGRGRISVTRWLHEFDKHGLVALGNILAGSPDFLVDMGDTFMTGKYGRDYPVALKQYLALGYYFGLVCHSAPLFLVLENHDGEMGR